VKKLSQAPPLPNPPNRDSSRQQWHAGQLLMTPEQEKRIEREPAGIEKMIGEVTTLTYDYTVGTILRLTSPAVVEAR
jgi:hypothetical protein